MRMMVRRRPVRRRGPSCNQFRRPAAPGGGAVSFSTRGALDPRRGEALPTRRALAGRPARQH
eukprot:scaffold5682_cov188-Prasinococcus_capsulatus_cf.AAC.1